ncbi:hypothetical protein EMCRGX_G020798 [Ephydatia muelleri]
MYGEQLVAMASENVLSAALWATKGLLRCCIGMARTWTWNLASDPQSRRSPISQLALHSPVQCRRAEALHKVNAAKPYDQPRGK